MANQNTRVVNGITTRVLHNRDYVEVNERVRILHELRKSGEITDFEMVESDAHQIADRWVWRVSARINGKLYIGNAEAKMDAPKNSPDGTNPFECAETSAFGRMLAFAGLGTVESIASYDEIARGKSFETRPVQEQRVVEAGNAQKQLPSGNGSLSDLIKRAKERAKQLDLAHNANEWTAILDYLQIKEIRIVADVGKINAYLNDVEQGAVRLEEAINGQVAK